MLLLFSVTYAEDLKHVLIHKEYIPKLTEQLNLTENQLLEKEANDNLLLLTISNSKLNQFEQNNIPIEVLKKTEVVTPLGISDVYVPSDEIVIASVMRAGLPLHNGFLNIFDNAENAFISAYRKYHDDNSFEIRSEYISAPSIEGKTLILVDPMLATGASILVAYKALLKKGKPKHTYSSSIRPDITKTPVPMWSLINLNNYSYFRTKIKFFPRIALFLMILNLVFFIKSFNSK